MTIKRKISSLVDRGYTQAAFSNKTNAATFGRKWQKKGYNVRYLRSSGPTVEGRWKEKAYYMVASKPKSKRK